MRGKKLVLVTGAGLAGAGVGLVAGIGKYEEGYSSRAEALTIMIAAPVVAVILARRIARRMA